MALGDRSGSSKQLGLRPPTASMLDNIDDLYENNAFDKDDDNEPAGNTARTLKPSASQTLRTTAGNNQASGSSKTAAATAKKVDFDVWVARKDKYERIAVALTKLNIERALNDEHWLELAVSLAATDCLLKTGKTDKCDCPGICREPMHSVTKQRTRCQCPAKKCSLCKRCIGTTPGGITDKMVTALGPYRAEPAQTMLALAEQVVATGDGQVIQNGGPKITTAVLRMAVTVLAQCSILENADGTRIQRPCSCPVRSLGDLWVRWTTKHHTFSRVPLSEPEAQKFSHGTRQMMEFDAENKTYYMTLKWHQAAKPQKGDTAKIAARRQLTVDQKRQNVFFLSLCKKYWMTAQHRVVEQLQAKMTEFEQLPPDVQRKKAGSAAEMEVQILNRIGVKRILQWVEEDQDAIEEQKREEQREKADGGVVAHNAWVKRKDRLRIRMPDNGAIVAKGVKAAAWKPPRFDFSSGTGVVRNKNIKVPSSTVDIMKNSGLKYVHAMSEGFQGRGGDLEKCKQQLVKQGHILKANFNGRNEDGDDPFARDRYEFEKEHNPELKKKKVAGKAREGQSQESYTAWIAHKALRDKAIKLLPHIAPPKRDENDDEDDNSVPASVRWEEVGKALKAIDRTLLDDWVKWSDGFRNASRCRMLWESFAPVACDVHCTSSAIRDVFLKLLHRKGVNYKQAFLDHCERKHKKLLASGEDDLPDEMTEEEQFEHFASLNNKEFTKLLRDLGIVLQPEEIQRLLEYFDTNGDQLISMKEFLDVVGEARHVQCHGDTDKLLQQVCMWETVCHECGMLNAFQLVIGSAKPGTSRMRSELPGHIKRREQSARFDCHPECDMREVKSLAPKRCPFSTWTDEQAVPMLRKLELWSAENREQYALKKLVTEGVPPGAPTLFRDDDETLDPTTMILLRWHPPPVRGNNGAAFYMLETIGAEGTPSFRMNDYREIYRDPKDYTDNNGEPRYHFVVSGLSPNTKYGFRIRALNGFGAGPFTFGYFFTAPAIPPAPQAIKVGVNSIHLGWESSSYYRKQLRELRQVFDEADVDGNGQISRDEFMEEIERRKPRLLEFLQKTNVPSLAGDNARGVPLSVFDAIETDDNESISWDEFRRFFHGFMDESNEDNNAPSSKGSSSGRSLSRSASGKTLKSSGSLAVAKKTPAGVSQSRYILKQCVNDGQGEYVEIYRGTKCSFVVHGLASGSTYQFRVQAYNEEDMFSLHSEPVVVNTLLQTPAPPILVDTSSNSTSLISGGASVKLKWTAASARPCLSHEALQARSKQTKGAKGATNDDQITRILKEWAQETSLDEGTVDFRAKFDRYDVDKSEFIDLPEFRTLLEELGVPPSDERLAAYMAEFDTDKDGKISFAEFTRWWNKTDVQYVLKRDSGRKDTDDVALLPSSSLGQMNVVSYRGLDTSTIVSGLEPNTRYSFRLRTVSSHASSQLSDVLEVWTPPSAPSCAGVITVLSNCVQIGWFPGAKGASKFIVETKCIETLPSSDLKRLSSSSLVKATSSGDWVRAYEGSDRVTILSDLLPNTVYRVRVFALNGVGIRSDQSTVAQFCTLSKDEERSSGAILKPSNAASHFTIECCEVGDVVMGDTVLFSERLVRGENGKIMGQDANQRGGLSASASVYSLATTGGSSEPVGERTVAARVVGIAQHDKYGNVLTMVVVWCTVQLYEEVLLPSKSKQSVVGGSVAGSNRSRITTASKNTRLSTGIHASSAAIAAASASYALVADLKISRKERSLYRFDTFRKEWADERARHASTWER